MKLYREDFAWAERMVATATPSITLDSAVPAHLKSLAQLRERIKIRVRALLHPLQTPAWLRLLNSHPAFSDYVRNCPRFLYKVYRPYNSNALGPEERLAAIQAHYQFIFRRGLGQVVARASMGAVVLAAVEGKSGMPYEIQLRTVNMFDREGELVLQLAQDGKIIYTVAFTVAPRAGRAAISIGCVQGGRTDDAREAIRLATRDLHGMRPKQLMVSLVRQLGFEYGCERLYLVSNRNRVIYKALRNGYVMADYDTLWEELGAVRNASGDFELDCAPVAAPDLEAIPSKKRSEARKRHDMMCGLADSVCVSLHARI